MKFLLLISFLIIISKSAPIDFFTSKETDISKITAQNYFFKFGTVQYNIVKALTCGGLGCPFIVEDNNKAKKIMKLSAKGGQISGVDFSTRKLAQDVKELQNSKENAVKCPTVLKLREALAYRDLDLEVDGVKAFAMLLDYVDGKNLIDAFYNPVTPPSKLDIAKAIQDIIEGVECIHTVYKRYHIDLKPANIMYDTTAKKAIVIDIDALVSEADIKDQELDVAITGLYVPVQDALTFDSMKIADKNDLNKGFDELYKFYDEFTVGEVICRLLLESIAAKKPDHGIDGETKKFLKSQKKKNAKKMMFTQKTLRNEWIAEYDKCKELSKNGVTKIFPETDLKVVQGIVTGLLDPTPKTRMSLSVASQQIKTIIK